jgi:hypothetical protein
MISQLMVKQEIEAAVGDYYGGWYAFDTEQIGRAMHKSLAKRNIEATEADSEALIHTTYTEMLGYTADRGGDTVPEKLRDYTIAKLDYYEEIASVSVESGAYIEYLHLARHRGKWRIVNVLWTYNRNFPKELRHDAEYAA